MQREFHITVDSFKIAGQLYLPDSGEAPFPAVILCHGVPSGGAPDPSDRGYPALAEIMLEHGYAAVIFNFRGAGMSQGNFNVAGWFRDLQAIIGFTGGLPEVQPHRIVLVGFSAGASVSVFTAANDKRVRAVAACACPADFSLITSLQNPQLSVGHFRRIGIIRDPGYPASLEDWLADFCRINALENVHRISPRPLLLAHADDDPVVPVENAYRLYEKALEPKKLVIVEGSEHKLRRHPEAVQHVLDWLKQTAF